MAVKTKSCCFPHAGGDVSEAMDEPTVRVRFSPRRWGCFPRDLVCRRGELVFPTQVGMFPASRDSSRRTQGFPHAGGDVSATPIFREIAEEFSPRRWGCFERQDRREKATNVFPTQVGMFPNKCSLALYLECFPHAGGDVSGSDRVKHPFAEFSPRRWGCFPKGRDESAGIRVFPT